MLQQTSAESQMRDIQAMIDGDTLLSRTISDVQRYDDTLVVFTQTETPTTFIRLILKSIWTGPIEVYCVTALMAGADCQVG